MGEGRRPEERGRKTDACAVVLCRIKLLALNHFSLGVVLRNKSITLKMKILHSMRQLTLECSFSMFVNILDLHFILKWTSGIIR